MNCPKCGSENTKVELVKMNRGLLLVGGLLLTGGLTVFLNIVGLIIGLVATAVLVVVAPGHRSVGICNSCGYVYDPNTGKKSFV